MNHSAAATIIRNMQNDIPSLDCTKDEMEYRSYCRWAYDELMLRLMEEELKLPYHITGVEQKEPIEIVWEFIGEMDWFSEIASTEKQKFIFSTAKYTADRVLQRLYS